MEKYNKFNFDDDDFCSFEYDELCEIVSINYTRSTFEIIKK